MGMCKHKDKEQALIDGIDRLKAKTEKDDEDGEPLAEELKSYVYVEACVKEALRMVGPGAFLARHRGWKAMDRQGYSPPHAHLFNASEPPILSFSLHIYARALHSRHRDLRPSKSQGLHAFWSWPKNVRCLELCHDRSQARLDHALQEVQL